MSKTEPTAGKWTIQGDYIVALDGKRETTIARTNAIPGSRAPERVANLHIMKASKEMLAALERVQCLLLGNDDAFEVVRAAIAHAKGEA